MRKILFMIGLFFGHKCYCSSIPNLDWRNNYWSLNEYEDIFIAKKVYKFCHRYETWLIDKNGKKITPSYRDIGHFNNGLAEFVSTRFSESIIGNHGYINKQGEVVVPPVYTSAGDFENGITWGIYESDYKYKLHFIDTTGRVIYETPTDNFSESFAVEKAIPAYSCNKDTKEMLFWNEGSTKLMLYWEPNEYLKRRLRESDKPLVVNYFGRYGYMDKNKILRTPVVLNNVDFTFKFSGYGLQRVEYKGRYGFVNISTGEIDIECQYEDTRKPSLGLFWVKKNSNWGAVDKKGVVKIPFHFENAQSFSENGLAAVVYNGKCGHIDTRGDFTTEPIYDEVSGFSGGYAVVRKNKLYGYISENGAIYIPLKFTSATPFVDGISEVKRWGVVFRLNVNGEYSIKNLSGNLVIILIIVVVAISFLWNKSKTIF